MSKKKERRAQRLTKAQLDQIVLDAILDFRKEVCGGKTNSTLALLGPEFASQRGMGPLF